MACAQGMEHIQKAFLELKGNYLLMIMVSQSLGS